MAEIQKRNNFCKQHALCLKKIKKYAAIHKPIFNHHSAISGL